MAARAPGAGFGRVVFVIKADLEEAFRERTSRTIEKHCETAYGLQSLDDLPAGFEVPRNRQRPCGTGRARLSCREVVHTPGAVINADDFYRPSSYRFLYDYLQQAQDRDGVHDYCMLGDVLENTLKEHGHVARGVCRVHVEIPQGNIVSMNMWGFTPSVFSELATRFPRFLRQNSANIDTAQFFLPEIIGDTVVEKRATVKVLPTV